ncbi:putative aldo-keto reductase [Oligella ureolytica]|uniref:aldo/keto reductase n=1 Tax=Oligella ureolytica TaxID=90244 RepID=UPI000E085B9B|nr:aldo/keto reductase [Oligella ureolytica]SUA58765.1 putative aldo-keto reductase [Oligella ureolytica]
MQKRSLGSSEVLVPPFVFGGNVFGWGVDEQQAFKLLDLLLEKGVDTIDTADIYSYWAGGSGGESETIIGKWMRARGNREQVIIHTKGGAPDAPGEFAHADLSAAYLTKAVEGSLRRLGTDYIDLYYVHFDDNKTPPEETLGAFQKLIEQGKIRAIGASNYGPERLRQALAVADENNLPRYACLQTHYNLYERSEYETQLEELCLSEGLGVLSYYSLASGFLSGKYRSEADLDKSAARGSSAAQYLNPRGLRILNALDEVADKYGATQAQIALAWIMARPGFTAAIASSTKMEQLNELLQATEIDLDSESIAELNEASTY